MFMHCGVSKTDTRYVAVYGMGRTDKSFHIGDPSSHKPGVVNYTLVREKDGRLQPRNIYLDTSLDQGSVGLFDIWELEQFTNLEQHGNDSFYETDMLNIEKFLNVVPEQHQQTLYLAGFKIKPADT